MTRLIKNVKQYVQLLHSVGQQGQGSVRRPLTPVECAHNIQRLIEEEGDSLLQVTERLGLGKPKDGVGLYKKRNTTQTTDFLNLLKVSEKSRNLAGWGYEGFPKIPFSLVAQLSTLKDDEQDLIIQSVYNADKKRVIGKNNVKKIKQWRKQNKDMSILTGIKEILKLKPVKEVHHLVVCETRDKLQKFINSNTNYSKLLLKILRDNLEGEFYSIDATDILITISMDATAYKAFYEQQYKKDIPFTQFLNGFLEDKIG